MRMNGFRKSHIPWWKKREWAADLLRLNIRVMRDALTIEDVAREIGQVLTEEELYELVRELQSLR